MNKKQSSLVNFSMKLYLDIFDYEEFYLWLEPIIAHEELPIELLCEINFKSTDNFSKMIQLLSFFWNVDLTKKPTIECKKILLSYCYALISGEIKPSQFCKLVSILDATFNTHPVFDDENPSIDWLWDLWNNCDWCDESWTIDTSPWLIIEAKRVISLLEKSDDIIHLK